jgi:hypothetical protein
MSKAMVLQTFTSNLSATTPCLKRWWPYATGQIIRSAEMKNKLTVEQQAKLEKINGTYTHKKIMARLSALQNSGAVANEPPTAAATPETLSCCDCVHEYSVGFCDLCVDKSNFKPYG